MLGNPPCRPAVTDKFVAQACLDLREREKSVRLSSARAGRRRRDPELAKC